jgi:hypothetical protein
MSRIANTPADLRGSEGSIVTRLPGELRGQVDLKPSLRFEVAIKEPKIVSFRPLLGYLDGLVKLVDGVVEELATIKD